MDVGLIVRIEFPFLKLTPSSDSHTDIHPAQRVLDAAVPVGIVDVDQRVCLECDLEQLLDCLLVMGTPKCRVEVSRLLGRVAGSDDERSIVEIFVFKQVVEPKVGGGLW